MRDDSAVETANALAACGAATVGESGVCTCALDLQDRPRNERRLLVALGYVDALTDNDTLLPAADAVPHDETVALPAASVRHVLCRRGVGRTRPFATTLTVFGVPTLLQWVNASRFAGVEVSDTLTFPLRRANGGTVAAGLWSRVVGLTIGSDEYVDTHS